MINTILNRLAAWMGDQEAAGIISVGRQLAKKGKHLLEDVT